MNATTLLMVVLSVTSCATGPRPVTRTFLPGHGPAECGPPPIRDFIGAATAVQAEVSVSAHRHGGVTRESEPVLFSTASEAYRLAELRDYQRCLLMHRDGACHALVAYYEGLWTFLETDPTAPQMVQWQERHRPPACGP